MKNIDIYAHPIKLHLNGLYQIKSSIGGYLTFLTICAMFLYAWFNGNDIFYKNIPNTYQEKMTLEKSNSITFLKNETFLYFQIFDGEKNIFIDSSIIELKIVLKHSLNSKLVNITSFKLHECNKTNFPNYENESNKNILLYDQIIEKRYLCPKFEEDLSIYGSWIEQNLTYFQILVYPCQNSTDVGICKSQEEIDETIWNKRLYLSFYHPLLTVSLNNYYNPFSYNYKEDYFYLPKSNMYRFYTYGIDLVFINTDWGFIKPDFSYQYAHNFNLLFSDERNINTNDPYFFSIDIVSTFSQNFYARSYIKITDILSNCGGLFNSVGLFFIVLNSFFFKFEMTKTMIDKLFVFKDPAMTVNEEYKTYNNYKLYNRFFNAYDNITQNNNKILKQDTQIEKFNKKQYELKERYSKTIHKVNKIETEIGKFITDENNTHKSLVNEKENEITSINLLGKFNKNCLHKRYDTNYSANEFLINVSDSINNRFNSPSFIKSQSDNDSNNYKNFKIKDELESKRILNPTNNFKQTLNSKKSKKFKNLKINNPSINTTKSVNEKKDIRSVNSNNYVEKIREKSNNKQTNNGLNKIETMNVEKNIIIKYENLNELPMPNIGDTNIDKDEYHKRYFVELLKFKIKKDKLGLSLLKQFKYNFCGFFYKKKHLNNNESKLYYLIDKYSEKTEACFDYLKLIKNYHETEILKDLLLEDYQKNILDIVKRKTIEIPSNLNDIDNLYGENLNKKSADLDKTRLIEASIKKLIRKHNHEKKYIKRKPIIKINNNLVDYLRKNE